MRPVPLQSIILIVAALLLMPVDAAAQTVVGSVVEAGTLQPLVGAFVVLEDEAGARQAAVLTGDNGRFLLRAPAPGRYRLVTRLIGYADATGEFLTLEPGETVQRSLEVTVRAISLEGIRAEVGKRCQGRPGGALRTARLWEEARKALEIAAWAEAEGSLRFRLVERRRELDASTLRVIGTDEVGKSGYYPGSPYRSVAAEKLEADGFVQRTPDGRWDHFAPDAEVLLSDSFLDTHCFGARADRDADLVGLAFEPVPGRTLPDIQGVLWLDRGTAELRRLEYRYVNLPYPHGDWPQVGGMVEFERLATGVWIVRRWHIRMPLDAERTGGFGGEPQQLSLRTLSEQGAEVSRVLTPTGQVLAEATGATLYGTVQDSATDRPIAGARVELLPTGLAATTGPDGVFRLGDLPGGTFNVEISHPALDLLGAAPPLRPVRLASGRATRLTARPPLSATATALCRDAGSFRDPVVLHGAVRDPDTGTPVPGAVVRIFAAPEAGETRRLTTDSAGGYVTCVERADAIEVAAAGPADLLRDPRTLDRTEVRIPDGVVARADLSLAEEAVSAAFAAHGDEPRGGRWSSAMIGSVVTADDRAPIAGAMVLLRKTDGTPIHSAVTNEAGQFRFAHPDPRTTDYDLSVEHVGYGAVTREVAFHPGEQLDLEVLLADRVIALDPIVVTQRRRGLLVDVGFYDRMERGAGIFIERDEIERRVPSYITDLMQGRSGLQVVDAGPMKYDIRITGAVRLRGDCQPAIWLDGSLVRDAGQPRVKRTQGGKIYQQLSLSEIISPTHIEAIEVYTGPAGMPMQYGGSNAACGVVLIWTRRGL